MLQAGNPLQCSDDFAAHAIERLGFERRNQGSGGSFAGADFVGFDQRKAHAHAWIRAQGTRQ